MATGNYQGELDTQYLTLGEALPLDISATATGGATAPDFSVVNVTLNFDGPTQADGSAGVRHTYRWRPAGTSDSEFSLDDSTLQFDLMSADIVADFYAGKWLVSFSIYDPATTQDEIGAFWLYVIARPRGPLPVSDA